MRLARGEAPWLTGVPRISESSALRSRIGSKPESEGANVESAGARYLKAAKLLSDLPAPQIAALARAAAVRLLSRREALFMPGDQVPVLYFIASGTIRLARLSPEGKEITLALLGQGDLVNPFALLSRDPVDSFAEALEVSTVVGIPPESLSRLMRANPELALRLAGLVLSRLRDVEQLVEDLACRPVPERLARLLITLGERHGRPGPGGRVIALRLTHADMASAIGSSRETVTLFLNAFRREGLIAVHGARLVVRRPSDLRRLLGLEA